MKFVGYAPDLDPTTPGIFTNCSSFIPTLKGYAGAPTAQSVSIDSLAAACKGAAVVTKLDDSTRMFAGSATKLYELSSSSWTDRTRASGGNYGLASDSRWCFAQFGNVSLAANKADIIQFSSSGAFANIGASIPKVSIVVTVGQFVIAFDCNDAGGLIDSTDSSNRWWTCAKGDYTNWTPSIPNECYSGVLTSAPGPIKAAKRFGNGVVAYKERSMFFGTYQGGAVGWDFQELPGEAGALGQQSVVDVGTPENPKHIFMGRDDFYQFDGSRAVPIGSPLRETVFSEINRSYQHLSIALLDSVKGNVRFFYCSSVNVTPDKCVVYNYKTGKWGRDDRTIEMAIQYVSGGITYDALGTYYSTYEDLPGFAFDSSFWTSKTQIPAIFDTSHTIKTLNGASTSSSVTLSEFGADNQYSTLARVAPRWMTRPTSANLINYYKNNSGDSFTTDFTTAMDSSGRFDFMREAKWHTYRMDFTGPVELSETLETIIAGGSD